jgi:hypothetical protein
MTLKISVMARITAALGLVALVLLGVVLYLLGRLNG